ncbi:MAG TPA: hypothetical protein EYG77_04705 [Methanothermococcus okinawensis]|uniref:Uncharacterized protein n=1 Tax=Methanofervidicoccus abyssi TaxID=2082189 RepID=A0A401HQX9_9EURY|nr:hypothetical protein [Methanofervidicoccus abyssi]GBF36615.1 hypothetical protein MHHB_P0845 [Methanofervidicoccus abyssi]HIP16484.1 hypothetical protein [Methanothermococcus okinawensis]
MELIILKDKDYEKIDKLKEYFKRYIDLNNEIDMLEETLESLDTNSEVRISIEEGRFLSRELKRYLDLVKELENQLERLNSSEYITIINYHNLKRCIEVLKSISININCSLKWDIYYKIEDLKRELKEVEEKLKEMVLDYKLKRSSKEDNG